MGIADDTPPGAFDAVFAAALERGLPVLCSNPDRTAPRAGGVTVVMPGTLAHRPRRARRRGAVLRQAATRAVFRAVEAALDLPPERILMVGDSLEHDIAGAAAAGWHSVFIGGGLHAAELAAGATETTVADLAALPDGRRRFPNSRSTP